MHGKGNAVPGLSENCAVFATLELSSLVWTLLSPHFFYILSHDSQCTKCLDYMNELWTSRKQVLATNAEQQGIHVLSQPSLCHSLATALNNNDNEKASNFRGHYFRKLKLQ